MRGIVSAALAVSALLGGLILKTDAYLWAAAPSHAYGLAVFVVLDLALIAATWTVGGIGLAASALLAGAQFAAMAGDLFVGQPQGLPLPAWQQYILGDDYFVALFALQPAIIAIVATARRMRKDEVHLTANPP